MPLALFDLDNTLLTGDSDYLWGCFLVAKGVLDTENYARENQRFFADYQRGNLDIDAYLEFQLGYLANYDMATLDRWHEEFLREVIVPIIARRTPEILAYHRQLKHTLVIITATNRFVSGPIARKLGVDHLLATELEVADGRYTGRPLGVPCFQEGKITRLQEWMTARGENLTDSWFYSDSRNDIPLLSAVTHPVAVDPDDYLRQWAHDHGWQLLSLREDNLERL